MDSRAAGRTEGMTPENRRILFSNPFWSYEWRLELLKACCDGCARERIGIPGGEHDCGQAKVLEADIGARRLLVLLGRRVKRRLLGAS
jgi:hypothetical protein